MKIVQRISRRLRYGKPIIVVSGLPRSGTSMLMNMLLVGGVPLLTDGIRRADSSNLRGYFEYEPVKALENHRDLAWLSGARGKAVKVISFLLAWLPETYDYRVIFMQRDLEEIIASQDRMLLQREEPGHRAGDACTRELYAQHLKEVAGLLERRNCFRTLSISYGDTVKDPISQARRISAFLGRPLDVDRMGAIVDPRLYRNRRLS
jgi:hypothetical protein